MRAKSNFKYLVGTVTFAALLAMGVVNVETAQAYRTHRTVVVSDSGPRHGVVVRTLPRGYRPLRFRNVDYFYHGGAFYRRAPGGFVVVKAPVGAVVFDLPVGFRRVDIGRVSYYRYGDVYYRKAPSGYIVAEAPAVHVWTGRGVERVSVAIDRLNVRSGPGLKQPVLAVARKGTVLHVRGEKGDWWHVQGPRGESGWVMKRFTAPRPVALARG